MNKQRRRPDRISGVKVVHLTERPAVPEPEAGSLPTRPNLWHLTKSPRTPEGCCCLPDRISVTPGSTPVAGSCHYLPDRISVTPGRSPEAESCRHLPDRISATLLVPPFCRIASFLPRARLDLWALPSLSEEALPDRTFEQLVCRASGRGRRSLGSPFAE